MFQCNTTAPAAIPAAPTVTQTAGEQKGAKSQSIRRNGNLTNIPRKRSIRNTDTRVGTKTNSLALCSSARFAWEQHYKTASEPVKIFMTALCSSFLPFCSFCKAIKTGLKADTAQCLDKRYGAVYWCLLRVYVCVSSLRHTGVSPSNLMSCLQIKMKVEKSQADVEAERKRRELLAVLNGFYD